jgi:hypothetical protein
MVPTEWELTPFFARKEKAIWSFELTMKDRASVSKVLLILFIAQMGIFAWFTGAIVRNEQSPYVWIEYSRHLRTFGTADAVFGASLYVLYYCFLIEAPVLFLWAVLMREKPSERRHDPIICGCWVLATFLVFAESIAQFLRNVPTEVLNGWLVIGWVVSTVIAGRSVFRLINARLKEYQSAYKGQFGIQLDRYEQFLIRHDLLNQFFDEEFSRTQHFHENSP